MREWEYCAIDLSDLPYGADQVDLLNDAGEKGWELVVVTANNIAYLKRRSEEKAEPVQERLRKKSRVK